MIQRLRAPLGAVVLALAAILALGPIAEPGPTDPAATGSAEPSPAAPTASASPGPTALSAALPVAPYRPILPTADFGAAGRLNRALDQLRETHAIPGIGAAILFPDGSVWVGAGGLADVEAGLPVTEATGFALASISKTFTAAAVLALVEEDRLGLDDAVADRLPGYVDDRRITVRMLLDHTSGLADFFLDRTLDAELLADRGAVWSAERSLTHVGQRSFAPGAGWRYSNTNYLLLGLLVERVTGRPLAVELRERFIEPLGLASLTYQGAEPPATTLARGYRVQVDGSRQRLADGSEVTPFTSVVTASGAAGAMAGSPLDVARWAEALFAGRVVSPESLTRMIVAAAENAARPRGLAYGLGVQAYPVAGRPALGHSGRFLGAQGAVRYLPRDGVTIAVLTNQSRVDPAIVLTGLLRIAAPDRAACTGPCPIRR